MAGAARGSGDSEVRTLHVHRHELVIVVVMVAFAILISTMHELLLGAGIAGMPRMAATAFAGALFWSVVIIAIIRGGRWIRSRLRKA